jgi:hypothetical protein
MTLVAARRPGARAHRGDRDRRVKLEQVLRFAEPDKLTDGELYSEWAVDRREKAPGRFQGGEYFKSPCGRVEYLLDRPEYQVARIDDPCHGAVTP